MTNYPYSSNNDAWNGDDSANVPLYEPLYGATFSQAIHRFFAKFAQFKGFASRSEYWWVKLALLLAYAVIFFISFALDEGTQTGIGSIIFLIFNLVILVPDLSLTWRRLHDAGFAGPWYFIGIIPIVGTIAVLVMTIMDTRKEMQKPIWDVPA